MRQVEELGVSHGWRLRRAVLEDGRKVFAKTGPVSLPFTFEPDTEPSTADESFTFAALFAAEAAGLRWLGEAIAVPEVVEVGPDRLVLSWVETEPASASAAERFGRSLARLHRAGADTFGAPWPGFIADLPMDNAPAPDWPTFYASHRIMPFVRRGGVLSSRDVQLIEKAMERLPEIAGSPEPPARIHGDLWSGNVLWSGGTGVLIDPAAHGGHRETDLAMLALFGAPYLERILGAYQEEWPLGDGWRERVPLHQLHPLLVHVVLYGESYRGSLMNAVEMTLRL